MTRYANTLQQSSAQAEQVRATSRAFEPSDKQLTQPFREDAVGVFLQPELAEHPDFHDGWGEMRLREVSLDREQPEQKKRIIVTSQDQHRLRGVLVAQDASSSVQGLASELRDAQVVCPHCVSRDVVTMNSKVVYEDLRTNEQLEVQLVYPEEAAQSFGRVSVLDALGGALLGRSVGSQVNWSEQDQLRLVDIPYQPEAAGDRHL
jgi:regulator of nucleoside diphosphate kinase